MQQCLNRCSDMCHTRWTIKIDTLGSIISNGIVLQSTWDDAKDVGRALHGDEGKQFTTFRFI